MTLPVCIIGAGPAGLAAARALRERGVSYVHLERNSGVGGLWDIEAPGGPMYESAHFISSKTKSGFSGYPMPDSFPDYPSHRNVLAYLRDFADAYGLTDQIEFRAGVAEVRRVGSTWAVIRTDGTKTEHESVIVCTGSQWHPFTPGIHGDFTGEVRHTVTYRRPDEFAGRRVLIVGGGNSGCDIACDAARTAEYAAISMRRGYWFIPKHVFGRPSDVIGGKGSFLPKPVERGILQPLLKLLTGDPTRLGLQKPDHRLFETHPVLNSQLFHYLQHGDITARPGIDHADGHTITFTDGTSDEFDLVMMATGYRHRVPVAQQYFGNEQHPDLYLSCISREYPGLYGIGFTETNSGAYQLFDRQAHLIASYLQDQVQNPQRARAFAARFRTDRPDLSGGLRFDSSPRHAGYVDSDAYVHAIEKIAKNVRWTLSGQPPMAASVSKTAVRA